ncbi:MAG TPA: hypothetical protein VG106_07615, partial [Vicinamibacterales bacterium]|nr:hypothetical protein [Vicinamibacterales bacterium]
MPTPFGAGRAALSFVFLFAAQFWAGVVVIFAAVPIGLLRGGDLDDSRFFSQLLRDVTPPLLLAGGVLSIALLAVIARVWAWDLTRDLVRRVPRPPAMFAWALAGAGLAALYIFVVQHVVPPDPSTPLGPLAKAASQSGASRVAWALLAFFFAPPFEELLFRGLML